MIKTFEDADFFEIIRMRGKEITLYNNAEECYAFIEGMSDKYVIPHGTMAFWNDNPYAKTLAESIQGFDFGDQDVKLEGGVDIFQEEEFYILLAMLPVFSQEGMLTGLPVQPVILKVGNALEGL